MSPRKFIPEMSIGFYKRFTNCKNSNAIHLSGAYIVSSLFINIISVNHCNPKRLVGHPMLFLFYIGENQGSEKLFDHAPGYTGSKWQSQLTLHALVSPLDYTMLHHRIWKGLLHLLLVSREP